MVSETYYCNFRSRRYIFFTNFNYFCLFVLDIDDINHIPLFIDIKPYLVPIADASNLTKLQSSTFSFLCQVQTGNWGLKQVEKLKRKFFMKAQELVFPFDDTIPLFDVDWKGFFQWFCTNVEGCGAGWDMFLRRVVQQFATLDQQQQGQAGEWDFVDALLEFRENKKRYLKNGFYFIFLFVVQGNK